MRFYISIFLIAFLVHYATSFSLNIGNDRKPPKPSKYDGYSSSSSLSSSDSDSDSHEHGHHHGHHHGHEHHHHQRTTKAAPTPPRDFVCEPGWTKFERQSGPRCLRVFGGGRINQAISAQICQQNGAVLSGLENGNEADWMAAEGLQFYTLSGFTWNYRLLYLGGARRPECHMPYALTCYPKETNMFYWTDPSITGIAGWRWWVKNPDNAAGKGGQHCLQIAVSPDSSPKGIYSAVAGYLDDIECNHTDGVIGCVCSKAATQQ